MKFPRRYSPKVHIPSTSGNLVSQGRWSLYSISFIRRRSVGDQQPHVLLACTWADLPGGRQPHELDHSRWELINHRFRHRYDLPLHGAGRSSLLAQPDPYLIIIIPPTGRGRKSKVPASESQHQGPMKDCETRRVASYLKLSCITAKDCQIRGRDVSSYAEG